MGHLQHQSLRRLPVCPRCGHRLLQRQHIFQEALLAAARLHLEIAALMLHLGSEAYRSLMQGLPLVLVIRYGWVAFLVVGTPRKLLTQPPLLDGELLWPAFANL